MPCLVCQDSKTVKSHLTPRAFVRDILGGHKHAFEGSRNIAGWTKTQSGIWDDDLLCLKHERALRDCDDYAARWVRNLERRSEPCLEGHGIIVPNPKPHLLLKFVCSHVWRHAMSRHNAEHDMRLGPWESRLRQLIFDDACDYNPAFHIFRQSLVSGEVEQKEVLFAPYRNPQFHRRAWQFYLGGLLWVLFLNDRRRYSKIRFPPANDSDPLLIIRLDEQQITKWPGVVEIVANMASKHRRDECQNNRIISNLG